MAVDPSRAVPANDHAESYQYYVPTVNGAVRGRRFAGRPGRRHPPAATTVHCGLRGARRPLALRTVSCVGAQRTGATSDDVAPVRSWALVHRTGHPSRSGRVSTSPTALLAEAPPFVRRAVVTYSSRLCWLSRPGRWTLPGRSCPSRSRICRRCSRRRSSDNNPYHRCCPRCRH